MTCLQQAWTSDRHNNLTTQESAGGVSPYRLSIMNGQIEGLFLEIENAGTRRHIQRDPRMLLDEIGNARHQPARAECRQGRHTERRGGLRRSHGAQHRILCLIEKTPHFRQKLAAGIGKQNALANALEQQHAELAFEILDLTADSALGEIELVRGLGETSVTGSTFKGLQRGDVRDQSSAQLHSILALT